MKIIKNLSGTILFCSMFLSHADVLANTEIIVGGWESIDNPYVTNSLILTNNDLSKNWAFLPNSQIYTSGSLNTLYSASCTVNFCIAVGGNADTSFHYWPLLLTSTNPNNSWRTEDIDFSSFPGAYLNDANCNEGWCAAVGGGSIGAPLIITTHNLGASWSFSQVANLPKNYSYSLLRHVSCTDNSCVAIGDYWDSTQPDGLRFPLLLSSVDQGMTWSVPASAPADHYYAQVDCSASTCALTADGSGLQIGGGDNNKPWTSPNLSGPAAKDLFTAVTHYQTHWVAGGNLSNNTLALAWSKDDGKNWASTSYTLSNTSPTDYGAVQSMSCNDTVCIATGSVNYDPATPFILTSYDYGQTWSQATIVGLPEMRMVGLSAKCNKGVCTAFGVYDDYYNDHPLMLTSSDNGQHWSFIPSNAIANAPANMASSFLNGITDNQL